MFKLEVFLKKILVSYRIFSLYCNSWWQLVFKQIGSLGRLNPDLKLWQSQELDSKYLNSLLRQKTKLMINWKRILSQDAELARKKVCPLFFQEHFKERVSTWVSGIISRVVYRKSHFEHQMQRVVSSFYLFLVIFWCHCFFIATYKMALFRLRFT